MSHRGKTRRKLHKRIDRELKNQRLVADRRMRRLKRIEQNCNK